VSDAGWCPGRRNRGDAKLGHPQDRETRCRIPACQLGVEHTAVVTAHMKSVAASERTRRRQYHVLSVHEAADGAPATLYLNDSWRDRVDGIRQLI
jgi:hypothetical protein